MPAKYLIYIPSHLISVNILFIRLIVVDPQVDEFYINTMSKLSEKLNSLRTSVENIKKNMEKIEMENSLLKKQQEDLKQAAFIEFFSPRSFLYAGESVTAEIRLYLWDRLPVTRIEKPPFKTGDAFSMTEIGEPNEKRNISKNNKSYIVFSWSVGLTAAMPGDHPLSFNTSIRIRASNRRTPFGNPFFNDPFFWLRQRRISKSSVSGISYPSKTSPDERQTE